ncbi:hypothetical protein M378DRAFT_422452 [Amanita muscaria Koide BX008]|uniref:Uncharacterized protein n=1 Tax=Amanita muscaria (strain Koide BX008) TaxID=946122 RepID=A0A0C2W7D9_AMAMK|nr:hypothetical protein M378DRAFT_422452 [Amanita muscaria Koide BX008]
MRGHSWPCVATDGLPWPRMAMHAPLVSMNGHAWTFMLHWWPCMGHEWPRMAWLLAIHLHCLGSTATTGGHPWTLQQRLLDIVTGAHCPRMPHACLPVAHACPLMHYIRKM